MDLPILIEIAEGVIFSVIFAGGAIVFAIRAKKRKTVRRDGWLL